jgi:hypothetical protein
MQPYIGSLSRSCVYSGVLYDRSGNDYQMNHDKHVHHGELLMVICHDNDQFYPKDLVVTANLLIGWVDRTYVRVLVE